MSGYEFKIGDLVTGLDLQGNEFTGMVNDINRGSTSAYRVSVTTPIHEGASRWLVGSTVKLEKDKPEFKFGDIVEGVTITGSTCCGRIVDINARHNYKVASENSLLGCYWLKNDTVQLAEPPAQPSTEPQAIVCRMFKGKPKPADCPVLHDNEQLARAESERLALLYPGRVYSVFTLVSSAEAEAVLK